MADTQKKTLREYETIFLVKPDLNDDAVDQLKERVRGIVGREGGKVLRFTVWGKKKLAYPIRKQPRAVYVHTHFLGGPSLVAEIERNLRNLDDVTRYISKKIADEVDPETRPVLEDVKLPGDIEEAPRPMENAREGGAGGGFRADAEEAAPAAAGDEDTAEEA